MLRGVLDEDGPLVVFVHGIGGVGKSALLGSFVQDARASGAVVVVLDGGAIEPTPRAFLAALPRSRGDRSLLPSAPARRLAALGPRVVLAIDRYEALLPLDAWLRRDFLPLLDDSVRVVLAGRDPPAAAWSVGWGGLFRSLRLGSLPSADAERLLAEYGVAGGEATEINRLARGHPLALRIAAASLVAGGGQVSVRTSTTVMVRELTELYLARLDRDTREALEAASVVRRPTVSLLAAMLPAVDPLAAFERLAGLPFVDLDRDGLVLHDTVREVVARNLGAADPDGTRALRIAAWRQIQDEVARAGRGELGRYTADLLYLVQDRHLRESWFPIAAAPHVVETARADDLQSVLEISRRSMPGAPVSLLEAWWRHAPWAFHVARDESGRVRGFMGLSDPEILPRALVDVDHVIRRWRDHLRASPLPKGQRSIGHHFQRTDPGDPQQTLVESALLMHLYRTWMELRPALRRYYGSTSLSDEVRPPTLPGLWALPGGPVSIPEGTRYPFVVDFGPKSVDGWLAHLIATELGVLTEPILDVAQGQLVLDGHRVNLTRLELGVCRHLVDRSGEVVERAELMREVWGYADEGGSNVIEVAVRAVRRKLGDRAWMIETVRGVGYRFIESR